MGDSDRAGGISPCLSDREEAAPRARGVVAVALALTLAWLAAGVGLSHPGGGPAGAVLLLLPVGLIWVAALAFHGARRARADVERLRMAVDALRQAHLLQAQGGGRPLPERRAEAAAEAAKPAPGRQRAPARLAPAPSDPQPSLALGAPADMAREPLSAEEFVLALNFPDDQNDREGFRVLRRALEDHGASKLIRASQDVLTLLAHEGIYMDDLKPDRARPEIWRRFAQGERGRAVAALGGVRDRSSLALTASRMREDVIFRDAAHHFLRHFDRTVSAFVDTATDQEIADLAETRTARAFMLLGRVTGTFD